MSGAVVVMAVPPNQAEAATRALGTCNAALGEGKCAFLAAEEAARWYAQVRFEPERKELIAIELFDRTPDGERVASSQLEFKAQDPVPERWASVGVVVAALVAAQTAASLPPAPSPAPPAPAPAPKRAPPVSPTPLPQRVWLRADVGATGGSELANGTLRFGGFARVGVAASHLPAFALTSVAYSARGHGAPELSWLTFALGAGAHLAFAHDWAALDVRAEAVLERVAIRASAQGRSESAERTRVGPRLGLDLSGYVAHPWALFVGLEAAALRPAVVIGVGGNSAEHLPLLGWGVISGLRYDFR